MERNSSGGNNRKSILADTFESLIGALYITTDYQTVMKFALHHLAPNLKQALEGKRGKDYKTLLQEFVQRDGDKHIVYNLIGEAGPDHAKTFTMEVSIDGVNYEAGSGKSKKNCRTTCSTIDPRKVNGCYIRSAERRFLYRNY